MTVEALRLRERLRPLPLGASIGTRYGLASSLGLFVRDDKDNVGFLTGASTLGGQRGFLQIADPVYQPGAPDGPGLTADNQIGLVENFSVVTELNSNSIDAAFVRLGPNVEYDGNRLREAGLFGNKRLRAEVPDLPDLHPLIRVAKIGRGSGLTKGTVSALKIDNLTIQARKRTFTFSGLIEVTGDNGDPFSLAGDSGAVVFTTPNFAPLGFVLASGRLNDRQPVTYLTRLDRTLELLRLTILDDLDGEQDER